jgi:hypothetical protein
MCDPIGGIWAAVPGFPGYEAWTHGCVRSLDRADSRGYRIKGKVLKGTLTAKGYLRVCLWRNGVPQQFFVHQVILLTFVGPCPPGQMGRHGPAGVSDNSVANLCYGTNAQNQADRIRDNTTNRGERNGRATLVSREVTVIRRLGAAGASQDDLADQFGVTRRTIGRILCRQTWVDVA